MLDFLKKKTEINTTQIVDEIEATVYEHIKPYGFKKHGRTLHRFVSEDISQVIHFQSGMPSHGMSGLLCVNLGIRIPECSERTFQPQAEKKKYYHEYECTIRSRFLVRNVMQRCVPINIHPDCRIVISLVAVFVNRRGRIIVNHKLKQGSRLCQALPDLFILERKRNDIIFVVESVDKAVSFKGFHHVLYPDEVLLVRFHCAFDIIFT